MAGRILRQAIRDEIRSHEQIEPEIVLSGLSNLYTHYVTTPEEYDAQVQIVPLCVIVNFTNCINY